MCFFWRKKKNKKEEVKEEVKTAQVEVKEEKVETSSTPAPVKGKEETATKKNTTKKATVKKPVAKKEETNKPTSKKAATKNATKKEPVKQESEEKVITNKVYHVSLRKADGKWQVKYGGGKKAIKLFNTQAEAIKFAEERADSQEGSISIHKKDGKIRKQDYSKKAEDK